MQPVRTFQDGNVLLQLKPGGNITVLHSVSRSPTYLISRVLFQNKFRSPLGTVFRVRDQGASSSRSVNYLRSKIACSVHWSNIHKAACRSSTCSFSKLTKHTERRTTFSHLVAFLFTTGRSFYPFVDVHTCQIR